MTDAKIKVGVLGATGTVGQRFILQLSSHPVFELAALGAVSYTHLTLPTILLV